MNETCILTFSTNQDRNRVIRIPEPRTNLNLMHVNSAATQIVPSQPFDDTVGQLVALIRAEQQTVSRVVLI